METLSRNEQIAVERCIKRGCSPISNITCLQNIKDNTFMIEAPLHLFVTPETFNVNNYELEVANYLSKTLRDKELEKSVLASACRRNLTFNSGLLHNDLVIFKNNILYIIEWNDESTHYTQNDHFDLAHRCFSDFIKAKLLSKKEGIVFKQVALFGTTKQKTQKINRTIDNIFKDEH